MVTAIPTVRIGGDPVALGRDGGALPEVRAVDSLRIKWGRSSVLEQPTPATASVTLADTSVGATLASRAAADLVGQQAILGFYCTDPAQTNGAMFRGRVTDAAPRLRRPTRGAAGGFTVPLSLSSREAEAANFTAPAGTSWPAETFRARLNRITALLPSWMFAGGVNLPTRADAAMPAGATELDSLTVAAADVGGSSALDLLRQLLASMSPLPAVYNPEADRVSFASRRVYGYNPARGMTYSAQLRAEPTHSGRYMASSLTNLWLDARQLGSSDAALNSGMGSRITRVEVKYTDAGGAAATVARAAIVAADDELVVGRRTMSVDTLHNTAAAAGELADGYAGLATLEGRLPLLDAVTFSTKRTPFLNAALVSALLAGYETNQLMFLSGSWLPALGQRPLVGVIGGTITYAKGEWDLQLQLSAAAVAPFPYKWAPLSVAAAATAGVRLVDLDPLLTFGDMAFVDVGAGYTTATQSPYKGNPA